MFNRPLVIVKDKMDERCKLFVGGLGQDVRRRDLLVAFSKYGVIDANLKEGYAFLQFESVEAAISALSLDQKVVVCGRRVTVRPSVRKNPASWRSSVASTGVGNYQPHNSSLRSSEEEGINAATKLMKKIKPQPIPAITPMDITDRQRDALQKGSGFKMKDIDTIQTIYSSTASAPPSRHVIQWFRNIHSSNPKYEKHRFIAELSQWNRDWLQDVQEVVKFSNEYLNVDDSIKFEAMIGDVKGEKVIFVDCEFNAWHGFTDITCKIQISTQNMNYIVDCLSVPECIATSLKRVFEDERIVKFMLGCGNALKALQRDFDVFIWPVIDVQFIDMHLNNLKSGRSLRDIASAYGNVEITKEDQRCGQLSNYMKRNVHPNLINYMVGDTLILLIATVRMIQDSGFRGTVYVNQASVNLMKASVYEGNKTPEICLPTYFSTQKRELFDAVVKARNEMAIMQNVPINLIGSNKEIQTFVELDKLSILTNNDFRAIVASGLKTMDFVVKPRNDGRTKCQRCGSTDHFAGECDVRGQEKAAWSKEYYAAHPGKWEKEKARRRDKRRDKRQVNGENYLWAAKKRDCFYGLGCTKGNCIFRHPEGWTPPTTKHEPDTARNVWRDMKVFSKGDGGFQRYQSVTTSNPIAFALKNPHPSQTSSTTPTASTSSTTTTAVIPATLQHNHSSVLALSPSTKMTECVDEWSSDTNQECKRNKRNKKPKIDRINFQ